MSSKFGIPGLLDGYYQEGGPPLEDADISTSHSLVVAPPSLIPDFFAVLTSLPINLLHDYHVEATKAIAVKDKPLLDSLEAVGFKLNPYPGGLFLKVRFAPSSSPSSFADLFGVQYFRDGGGYYINASAHSPSTHVHKLIFHAASRLARVSSSRRRRSSSSRDRRSPRWERPSSLRRALADHLFPPAHQGWSPLCRRS